MTEIRKGNWMQTYSGLPFYPLDPHISDIVPIDIAHSLSLLCRYGGHVNHFYSVAEHCVSLSYAVSPENALWALLHDATEAYVGDMIDPLKRSIPAYREIENNLMAVICDRFDIPHEFPAEVKLADKRILLDERDALMVRPPMPWLGTEDLPRLGVKIRGLEPREAEKQYFIRLLELAGNKVFGG